MPFLDLGIAPPSNAYLQRGGPAARPRGLVSAAAATSATQCWLVQTEDYAGADELFSADYAYFSARSRAAGSITRERYVEAIDRAARARRRTACVVEVASNDGYLLQELRGAPAFRASASSRRRAPPPPPRRSACRRRREFFGAALGERLARERSAGRSHRGQQRLAHVPDINDFTAGFSALLKPRRHDHARVPAPACSWSGRHQFDTVYHEHFSYLSLGTVRRDLRRRRPARLRRRGTADPRRQPARLRAARATTAAERARGRRRACSPRRTPPACASPPTYAGFQARAERLKDDLLAFLIEQKRAGRRVAAYGAAAKGNTLLNFAGVRPDLLPYVVRRGPSKQGKFLPGSHIPDRRARAPAAATGPTSC